MSDWTYRGRWALVTGASAGIGAEFAHALARRGMDLVLSARREERLRVLAGEIADRHGVRVEVVPADLSDPAAPSRLWTSASDGRELHLLVNNAGFGAQGDFAELPLDRQLEMVQVNCSAVLELAHLALQDMRDRREGGIINVSSVAAFQPVPRMATYAATKAFVLSLSEALHAEARPLGVRVLALCPGRTPTEFQEIAETGPAEGAFGVRTPRFIVEKGLDALERQATYSVPGVENRVAGLLVRVLPRSVLTRTLKRLVRRAAEKPGRGSS